MMRVLRQRVFKSLNKTQNSFIDFLSDPGSAQQQKVDAFVENYNKFTHEFPQLRENDKTQQELQNRAKILSQQLWEGIKQRNQEAVKERRVYMEGGWVFVEMTNLITYFARLLENEWLRFTTVTAIVTGFVLNEELDLQSLVKRLVERGVDPYDVKNDSLGSSPIVFEIVQTMLNAIGSLFNEQYLINLEHKQLDIINAEKQNLFVRTNMLIVYCLLILQEISVHSNKVFEVLDDWIVVAVKTENDLAQQAVKEIQAMIAQKKTFMDSVILGESDLASKIETIPFEEGPPLYMQEHTQSFGLADRRIDTKTLRELQRVFKANSVGGDLLDRETFLTLMMLELQGNKLPV